MVVHVAGFSEIDFGFTAALVLTDTVPSARADAIISGLIFSFLIFLVYTPFFDVEYLFFYAFIISFYTFKSQINGSFL